MENKDVALGYFLLAAKHTKLSSEIIKKVYNEMMSCFDIYSEDEVKKMGLDIINELMEKDYSSVFSNFINEKMKELERKSARDKFEKVFQSESGEEVEKVIKILRKYYPISDNELDEIRRQKRR